MNLINKKSGYIIITLVSISVIAGVLMLDPIVQDLEYHQFIDRRNIFSIPNFWNVISSLPFLLIGVMGLYRIFYSHKIRLITSIKVAYIMFFLGVSLVTFGSAYYHLWPGNMSLVWDRLPMTIAFMALFSIIICEFVSLNLGKVLLWPLIIFGVFSVFYWYSTEVKGEGDLRFYVLVQFLPVLLIPLILLFFDSIFTETKAYWFLLCAYVLAKILEYFDEVVYNALLLFSGHSLKHIVVALGVSFLLKAYSNRQAVHSDG